MGAARLSGTKPLADRVGLITGGGAGIGRATVLAAVEAGARVVVADLDEEGGAGTVELAGGEAHAVFVRTDVSSRDSAQAMVDATLEEFGRVDFAHNNAGIGPSPALLYEMDQSVYQRIIDINLTGVWNCLAAEIPVMLNAGSGSIVNTSSGLGFAAMPKHAAYIAAKAGVVGLTKAAAMEVGRSGVRVNAVCPGATLTPRIQEHVGDSRIETEEMNPMGRLGRPREIADAVVFLLSDGASYINGHSLPVEGGQLAQI
jgi:NAD(P)-dependent dehydrogenase (short-subunit alcohol dehydrogenase family)